MMQAVSGRVCTAPRPPYTHLGLAEGKPVDKAGSREGQQAVAPCPLLLHGVAGGLGQQQCIALGKGHEGLACGKACTASHIRAAGVDWTA